MEKSISLFFRMNQQNFSNLQEKLQTTFQKITDNISNLLENVDNTKLNRNSSRYGNRDNQRASSRYIDKLMEQQRDGKLVKITYEEIGLFPRSFNRVFDRVLKQILSEDIAELALQEYRLYRYLFLTTIKCLASIILVPLLINFAAKNWVIGPLTEYFWNGTHQEIFLNMDQQKRAFSDLQNLEDEIYFETLTLEKEVASKHSHVHFGTSSENKQNPLFDERSEFIASAKENPPSLLVTTSQKQDMIAPNLDRSNIQNELALNEGSWTKESQKLEETYTDFLVLFKEELTKRTIEKTKQIYIEYNEESVHMITHLISDLLSLVTLLYLLLVLDLELTVTKSFLFEMFFGLDDSRKSLIILLVTDLLVGYHSSNLWEVFFTFLFEHYGFNENHTAVYLLVATLPVLLDVLFKYLIFRHLNRTSPATVATYQALIE